MALMNMSLAFLRCDGAKNTACCVEGMMAQDFFSTHLNINFLNT